ncbi:PREDICTED: scavenger receptor cysteine-rich domain-containing group B protein-like [Sturnus vulgaris]|uniref:scavenger receptor cysteine-rich domain-containing group B protein-like n=1 Tax=Sturnus vulgaris TaxID=9172 RepID=UPI00071A5827|nr:PREDICTED: scavenger receptor cysteine-rich domain-containing group B protein-like [Sturnus vulgaris]
MAAPEGDMAAGPASSRPAPRRPRRFLPLFFLFLARSSLTCRARGRSAGAGTGTEPGKNRGRTGTEPGPALPPPPRNARAAPPDEATPPPPHEAAPPPPSRLSLRQSDHAPSGQATPPHRNRARCVLGVLSAGEPEEGQVRLAGGPHRCAGRVEVFHAGRWGTVCDDAWDLADAQVSCRQVRCGPALWAPGAPHLSPLSPVRTCPAGSGLADLTHLRLAGGPHRCAGRVQVLHEGRWGGVCGLTWAPPAARVTCRYLGCGPALRAGQVSVGREELTWVESLRCNGSEGNLLECQVKVWGAPYCPHATVTCEQPGEALAPANATLAPSGESLAHPGVPPGEAPTHSGATLAPSGEPEEGQVRLAGGPHRCAGRVEVFHAGRWGTVCDDAWDLADAQVVCRQLGCGPALEAPGRARFGRGSGQVWLSDLTCVGSERHLGQCPGPTWGNNTCGHGEDAGVVCAAPLSIPSPVHPSPVPPEPSEPLQVRLADGPHRCAGRVEVSHLGRWGTVCDDTWDLSAARVTCRHLGCGPALSAPGRARFGPGRGPVWLDQVRCTGEELTLDRCERPGWGEHDCDHREDAGVVCAGANPPQVRLQGGPGPCSGQVQVLLNHTWLQVCGLTWGLPEAQVLCRQLGCGVREGPR